MDKPQYMQVKWLKRQRACGPSPLRFFKYWSTWEQKSWAIQNISLDLLSLLSDLIRIPPNFLQQKEKEKEKESFTFFFFSCSFNAQLKLG
jgi:hypothetical protein